MSTGVHDPLLSSALYLSDGRTPLIFVASDVIFIGRTSAERARRRIADVTGIPPENAMLEAVKYMPQVEPVLLGRADRCNGEERQ